MKKIILAVYDSKTECYGMPFPADTLAQAVRDFSDAIADTKTMFSKHPEDYSLFELGSYDYGSGTLEPSLAPRRVITALECIKSNAQ